MGAPPLLSIQLLGGFHLVHDGVRLAGFDSPRLQSFLAYLLLNRNAPQLRQQIAFLFYPDSTEVQARANVRGLLRDLRQALAASGFGSFLVADGQTFQWRPEQPWRLAAGSNPEQGDLVWVWYFTTP